MKLSKCSAYAPQLSELAPSFADSPLKLAANKRVPRPHNATLLSSTPDRKVTAAV